MKSKEAMASGSVDAGALVRGGAAWARREVETLLEQTALLKQEMLISQAQSEDLGRHTDANLARMREILGGG